VLFDFIRSLLTPSVPRKFAPNSIRHKRRSFTSQFRPRIALPFAAACLLLVANTLVSGAEATYDLSADYPRGFQQQVRVIVEVAGDLKVNADGKDVKRLPLKVAAEMLYSERRLAADRADFSHTVRQYETAQATIRIQNSETKQTLRDDRRLIAAEVRPDNATLFSPLGPLTREELELIEIPGAGLIPAGLLPSQRVKTGETWQPSDANVALLMNLDAVLKQNIVCKLEEVQDGVAIISAAGKASGAVGGISSDIELKLKINVNLKQRMITWLAIALKEDRAIGHAQPGFDTVTRIRLIAAPLENAAQLTEQQLARLPLTATPGSTLLEMTTEKGGYELLQDRRWFVMSDRYDVAVLRLIDRGDLVAQCNVSKLPSLPKGQQLTLEGFQQDVKKSLGKSFAQFIEAGEDKSDNGIRILRVTVAGFASELPIQWIYFHLSDDNNHRASLVFTLESKLVEKYGGLDRELVSGFRFLGLPSEAGKGPTLAAPQAESAAKKAPSAKR
jgi:hypothetical protein